MRSLTGAESGSLSGTLHGWCFFVTYVFPERGWVSRYSLSLELNDNSNHWHAMLSVFVVVCRRGSATC